MYVSRVYIVSDTSVLAQIQEARDKTSQRDRTFPEPDCKFTEGGQTAIVMLNLKDGVNWPVPKSFKEASGLVAKHGNKPIPVERFAHGLPEQRYGRVFGLG